MNTRALLAATILTASLAGCANNPYPYREAGDSALKAQQWDKAAAEYEKYLEIKPGEPDMRHGLARAYIGQGKYLEATEQARTAYSQNPESPGYADTVAEALLLADRKDEMYRFLRTNCSERGRTDDWIRLGDFALRAGDADTAKTAYLSAARVDRGQNAAPQLALYEFFKQVKDPGNARLRLRMAYYAEPQAGDVISRLNAEGLQDTPGFGLRPLERAER